MKRTAIAAALAAALLSACSSSEGSDGSDGTEVSRDSMGDEWPFTVDKGTLTCNGSGGVGDVVFTTPDGTRYAVNGTAKSTGKYRDIMAIWADDPNAAGLKIDMSPLTDKGLALCD